MPEPKKPDSKCTSCKLCKNATTVCIRTSNRRPNPDLLLVGEAPGADEDSVGRNFVGDAGRKLNYCLRKAGLRRKDIPIANVGRCRPPGNQTPTKTILEACWPYTLHDILAMRPKVIVAMGASAMAMLAPQPHGGIKGWRGFPTRQTFSFERNGKTYSHTCWVIPTYHTAYALRDWSHDAEIIRDLKVAARYARGDVVYHMPTTKVRVLRTVGDAVRYLRRLRLTASRFVFDIESTGLDPFVDVILCVGFATQAGFATILPLLQQFRKAIWSAAELALIEEELGLLFEAASERTPGSTLCVDGQHVKFDSKFIRRRTGIYDLRVGDDTMVQHHLLDENKPHNLTYMLQWELGWDKYDAMNYPYYEKGKFKPELIPNEILWRYCGYDCDGTLQLRDRFTPRIAKQRLEVPYAAERDLIAPITDMEYRGVRIDLPRLRKVAVEYAQKVAEAEATLRKAAGKYLSPQMEEEYQGKLLSWKKARHRWMGEAAAREKAYEAALAHWEATNEAQLEMWEDEGRPKGKKPKSTGKPRKPRIRKEPEKPKPWTPADFTPGAPKDIARLLEAAGANLEKQTTSGLVSTDAAVLAALALRKGPAGRIAQAVRDLREYRTNKSKNLDGPPEDKGQGGLVAHVSAGGRIHTSYNMTNAVTGRLSSSDPQLHNIPRLGPFRGLFVPDNDDCVILAADYAKEELCVLAWMAEDEVMAHELINGIDLHTHMAVTVQLWRMPTDEEFRRIGPTIPKNSRAIAKGVNFGVPYGRTAYGIVEAKDNQDAFPIDMPREDRLTVVENVLEMYFRKYQGVARWREQWISRAMRAGFCRTHDGRIRHVSPGVAWVNSPEAADTWKLRRERGDIGRMLVNFPIQGYSNYILQVATRRCYNGMRDRKQRVPGLRSIMTIHDALNFSCPRKYVDDAIPKIKGWMERTLPADRRHRYEIPLKVDITVQERWGTEYEKETKK